MPFSSIQGLINELKYRNDIHIISEFVSPDLESTEINDRIIKNGDGKAILFNNNGTEFPLLLNMYGSEERMNLILGTQNMDEIGERIKRMMTEATRPGSSFFDQFSKLPMLKEIASWMPTRSKRKALCQQLIMQQVDLSSIPIPKCWPHDGGKFITLPMVHTLNPETGIGNVGMYRMQVLDNQTTGMHWHLHKDGARHYEMYKKRGEKMPVSVAIGGDPVLAYCASAPLPEAIDEYMLAGFLRQNNVRLVKCLTNDIYVPADADFIFEGYIDTSEDFVLEGPFGDHTGYYSLADMYPQFHITMITHRVDAVYPATIVGVPPQEDRWMGKATERIFLSPIQMTISPDILDMNLPYQGGFHNISIVKIDQHYPGQANSTMNALWGAGQMMFNKVMIVVPKNVNPHNAEEVLKALSEIDIENDILFTKGPADVLDHSGRKFAKGGKIGIDATHISSDNSEISVDLDKMKLLYPNLKVNTQFVENKHRILLFGIDEKESAKVFEVSKKILDSGAIKGVKILLFFDNSLDLSNFDFVLWQVSGNIDPTFDCQIIEGENGKSLCVDACSKIDRKDFTRNWPNVIVMDDETIKKVDSNWGAYNIGPFLESPSLSLKEVVKNDGAIANKDVR